jgi:hypothetical protein
MTKILGVDISPNDKSLTFSKMSDIATGNLVGRAAEGTGAMETLNASTVRTLLDVPVTSHTHPSILTTSISDGDITHAPDGNSVFDALSGKQSTGLSPLNSQAIAENDVLVGAPTPFGSWVKKTIDEFKTILGLGTAAYTASTAYDPAGTAAGKITTSISDGDITHAPDGNSVFDALSLKSDTNHTHEVLNMYSQIFYNVRR